MYRRLTYLFIVYLYLATLTVFAQEKSSQVISRKFESPVLKRKVNYTVYLPPTYHNNNLHYPVMYLLHGYGGNETSWLKQGNLQKIADSLIYSDILPETVIIMPDGGNSYFINNFNATNNYEHFFINEFLPFTTTEFRIMPQKGARSICGLSMGGFGALVLAAKHPGEFGHVIALSAAVRTPADFIDLPQAKYQANFAAIFGDSLQDKQRISPHWKINSPYFIIDSLSANQMKTINWYIDCGSDDFLFGSNKAFHEHLNNLGIPHEYHVRKGEHNWEYWQSGFVSAMIFLSSHIIK
ncbi:MAG: esterase family protein [Bacteroidales bacterium]|nr:esterase family protein [Bacteroidales bacterium]